MKESISFGVGLDSNIETNDFLRCLWSRIASAFGKLAWAYSPLRVKNMILVGQACVGENYTFDIRLQYKKRGCLSSIHFIPLSDIDIIPTRLKLKQCISEALQYDKYKVVYTFKGSFESNTSFCKREGRNFVIEGNSISLKVSGFDEKDCLSLFRYQFFQICNFLTFDTLVYITTRSSLMEEIRNKHNYCTVLVNQDNEEEIDKIEKNETFKKLKVSDEIADYIDSYLDRSYNYESHLTNFDKSVQLFAQGIRNEELSKIEIGIPEPYSEQAIVDYMSALEVITLNDREPFVCKHCGQVKFSIARRVMDLANKTFPRFERFVKDYYNERSKYVHTGELLSTNNYINRSIPLMSICQNSSTGMINQIGMVDAGLKDMVKECIMWHESKVGIIIQNKL